LFDGFPRTVAQAEALDKLLSLRKTEIAVVLALQVNEDELITRLVNRAKTSGRQDDANVDIQRRRQEVYKNETLPVSAHYKKADKVISVNGEGSIDEIFERLQIEVDEKKASVV